MNQISKPLFFLARPQAAASREYSFYFFYKNALSDMDVFQIRLSEKSVGWCLPVAAFDNEKHRFYDNPYFHPFAAAAFDFLLRSPENCLTPTFIPGPEWSLSRFYDKNVVVVGISKDHCDFSMDRYIPWLFSRGYFYYNREIVLSKFAVGSISEKYLNLVGVNEDFVTNSFVLNMYKNVLVRDIDPLAVFLLNYQIFEQMIHISFDRKLAEFKSQVASFAGTSSDFKDAMRDLGRINDELTKLKDYVDALEATQSGMQYYAKRFARVHGDDRKEDFASSLYAARNKILHNYRNLKQEEVEAIVDLNNDLFEVVPRLICSGTLVPVEIHPSETVSVIATNVPVEAAEASPRLQSRVNDQHAVRATVDVDLPLDRVKPRRALNWLTRWIIGQ